MSECHGRRTILRVEGEVVVLLCSCGREIPIPRCTAVTLAGARCQHYAREGGICWSHQAAGAPVTPVARHLPRQV